MGVQSGKNVQDVYPLTPMQRGIIFHDLLSSGSGRPYIQQVLWRLQDGTGLPEFRRAWQHVVARHPVLRTFVIWQDRREPIQVVCREVALPWNEIDWSDVAQDELGFRLDAHLAADRAEGFVLTRAPLMRLCAIRLPDASVQMIWTFHHVAIDGWSLSLILAEVLSAYESFRNGQRHVLIEAAPYRRFVDWVLRRDEARDRSFWTHLFTGFTGPTPVPGTERIGIETVRGETTHQLGIPDTEAVQSLCARHRLTPSVVAQAAWAILLNAYSHERDIVFGLTVAGRPPELPDGESIAGLMINSIPVRLRLDGTKPILELLRATMEQQSAREDHLHAPLDRIKTWAGVSGDAALFDSLVVYENYPVDRIAVQHGARTGISGMRAIDATSFALTLIVAPGETLELKLLHDRYRLSTIEARQLLKTLACILSGIAADCTRTLAELPLVNAEECDWLLRAGRGTQRDWRQPELLHRLIEEQVGRSPDAIAVRFEQRELTFRELDSRANQLAHRLRRLGVGPDRIVGIAMHRSIEMIVGLLGILKAGGAFLPIDPASPAERLAFMLDDADVSVLLVHPPVMDQLPPQRAHTICLDSNGAAVADEPAGAVKDINVGPEHLAYVIYTSGSTGLPKGAMNAHRAICNRLLWMQRAYGLKPDDRVLQKTPCSFDVSVWEYFWPLLTGARLVVARPDGHQDPTYLAELIKQEQITTLHFVPSMLQVFLDQEGLASCASLRRTICSGEALTSDLVQGFFTALPGELHNLYGPAEAAVDVTYWPCQPDTDLTSVPIGRPIDNVSIYLLDGFGRFVPRGMPGELHIGGVAVGRGYHNRTELTAEKFITASLPAIASERLYRTGDLARWREDGALEYLGRRDNQIKLRGMRIDLGEVEAAIRAVPAVKAAVAVLERGSAGQDQIVAYVTATDTFSGTMTDALDALRQRLPSYMVPSRVVRLERLPLSQNGKLDRNALAALTSVRPARTAGALPQSTMERAVADVWRDVLRVDVIGLKDNFFELGGTSLLMVPVHSRLRDHWDRTLALVEMFRYPTVEALARRLAHGAASTVPAEGIRRPARAARDRAQLVLRARRQAGMRGDQSG